MRVKPPKNADPAETLAHEAQIARAAMGAKLQGLKTSVQATANPRAWAERHPWIALAVAAGAGVAAARTMSRDGASCKECESRRQVEEQSFSRSEQPAAESWGPLLIELGKIVFKSYLLPMFQAWQQSIAEAAADGSAPPSTEPSDEAEAARSAPHGEVDFAFNGPESPANGSH